VVMRRQRNPLCLTFRVREGLEGVDGGNTPSVSHFERARGVEGVCRQITPPSRNLSEGGVGGDALTEEPSVSQFERAGGWW
jgi:hypothetical protein